MYKTAFLGCGGRARAHASAYRFVKRGKIAAICDMNEELLNSFGDDFDVSSRYTDLDEMLEKEKPDVLHIVTAPVLRGTNQRIRYSLMKQASDHGVPAAIVEKPIAVESEDWKQIAGLAEETKTKFVVNTQLNFHPQNLELKRDVADGKIGEIKFIDASARSTPVDQAPHVLQLVSSYIDNSRPVRVLGSNLRERTVRLCANPLRCMPLDKPYMKTVSTSLLRSVLAWGRWHRIVKALSRINVSLSSGQKVSFTGVSVVGNAQHQKVATRAVRSTMENKTSLHKATSRKRSLTGSTMRTTCIRRISSNRSQSSTFFWGFTIAG